MKLFNDPPIAAHLLMCVQSQITLVKQLNQTNYEECAAPMNSVFMEIGVNARVPRSRDDYLLLLESMAREIHSFVINNT